MCVCVCGRAGVNGSTSIYVSECDVYISVQLYECVSVCVRVRECMRVCA